VKSLVVRGGGGGDNSTTIFFYRFKKNAAFDAITTQLDNGNAIVNKVKLSSIFPTIA